jgi:hypothetical protein
MRPPVLRRRPDIDRGPESDRTLEFLAYEWLPAVQGNHERMLIESINDPDGITTGPRTTAARSSASLMDPGMPVTG